MTHLEEIPEVAVWRTRPGSDRQHYGDALSEQGRRDQFQVWGWKVREIIHWCLSMRITLQAVHISGQDNVEADRVSRFESRILADWSTPPNGLLTAG